MTPPETSPGVIRTRVKWLVVKRRGEWEIAAQQMLPLPPSLPPQP